MKNINIVIYGFLGFLIVSLLGVIIYLHQDNLKKTVILEKQGAIKSIVDIPIEDTYKALEAATLLAGKGTEAGDREKLFANLNKETKYCGTVVDFADVYFKTMEESLNEARSKAQKASFKSTVLSTITAVMFCIEDGGFVNAPAAGALICQQGEKNFWPKFNYEGATWGGCDFEIDKNKETFKYCATFGEIKAVCTWDGCEF